MKRRDFVALGLAGALTLVGGTAVFAKVAGGANKPKCDCCCGDACPMNKKDAAADAKCCCKGGKSGEACANGCTCSCCK